MRKFKNIVVFEDDFTQKDKTIAEESGLKLFTFEEIIFRGRQFKKDGSQIVEPEPEDSFMLSYTSGTTGDPKGVKLTHKMMINVAYAL